MIYVPTYSGLRFWLLFVITKQIQFGGAISKRSLLSASPVVLVPVEKNAAQVRARLTPVFFDLPVGHVPYPLEDRVDDLRWLLVSGIGWVPRGR